MMRSIIFKKSAIIYPNKRVRLRIGISKPTSGEDIADYVLRGFNAIERQHMGKLVDICVEAVELYLNDTNTNRAIGAIGRLKL